jgi:GT2 family glycosyltransferase
VTEPRLTVAIATYNGRELLATVLDSLAKQTFRDFRVVVVDDASTDGTSAWLADRWPEIEMLVHPANRGVTATLNACLRSGQGELVALLNNDVELDPNCLAELVRELDAYPGAAAAAAKLIDFNHRDVIDGAGDVYAWSGTANRRGHGERDVGQYDRAQPIFGACAGAALYRRSALDAVGLLDEDFFAFYEDVDWSFRAQLQGYSCRYVPTAIAYHVGGATVGQGVSDFMLYQNWRNAVFVVLKNYPLSALLRHGCQFLVSQAHNLVWAIQTDRLGIFLRVWRDTLGRMPTVLRKRRLVQRSRTVGLKDLERVIGTSA